MSIWLVIFLQMHSYTYYLLYVNIYFCIYKFIYVYLWKVQVLFIYLFSGGTQTQGLIHTKKSLCQSDSVLIPVIIPVLRTDPGFPHTMQAFSHKVIAPLKDGSQLSRLELDSPISPHRPWIVNILTPGFHHSWDHRSLWALLAPFKGEGYH